ncbi:MAG: GNAT family N-acetyltransferase [Gemmatimonadota bacterium]
MTSVSASPRRLKFEPLTAELLPDLERLFGERGACGGCWCMYYRLMRPEYEASKGEGNRLKLRALVEEGAPTGVLAYAEGEPVGWCSVAPREQFVRLARTRTMKSLDGRPSWVILCLFVAPHARGLGVSKRLLAAAARHALDRGAALVEAYPIIPTKPNVPPVFAFNGLLSAYLAAGFEEVGRPSETRAYVRYEGGG